MVGRRGMRRRRRRVVCIAAAVPLTASNNSEDSSLGDRSLRVLAGAIRSPASANGFISLL
jgi:hypothetical protein